MRSIRKLRILFRTLTLRKVLNAIQIVISFYLSKFLGKAIHFGQPLKLGIEPTTSCNLRCPECLSGVRGFTRPTGIMDFDEFRKLADETHKSLIYMLLYFQGEPYLHPRFLEMAAHSSSKKIYTATSTNGHYLDQETAVKTVRSGIHEVLISMDGISQGIYEKYRQGGKLEKVKEGIRNLVNARRDLKSLTPYIVIQFLVTGQNEPEIAGIQSFAKKIGADKVVFKTAQIREFQNGNPLIPKQEKYSRYREEKPGQFVHKSLQKNECWKLWQGAEITWDGRVLPCCFDKDAKHEMGVLNGIRFAEIWKNEKYGEFRQQLVHSRTKIDMCRNCSEGGKVFG